MRGKGKSAILAFPNMWADYQQHVNVYERFGQETINDWGAERRAFLSSCIRDRKWKADDLDEDCELKFHGGK